MRSVTLLLRPLGRLGRPVSCRSFSTPSLEAYETETLRHSTEKKEAESPRSAPQLVRRVQPQETPSPATRETRVQRKRRETLNRPIDQLSLCFLGTSSAVPTRGKAHASVALKMDADVWLFDAGEGTYKQFLAPSLPLRQTRLTKIFITHLHGDHVMGLLTFLTARRTDKHAQQDVLHLYGPYGLRSFLRANLLLTQAHLGCRFQVHELRTREDPDMDPVPLPPHAAEVVPANESRTPLAEKTHSPGSTTGDIYADENGAWVDFIPKPCKAKVTAVSIQHTVPCLGFVVQERRIPAKIDPDVYLPPIEANKAALFARGENPYRLLRLLQYGQSVTLPDGTKLLPPSVSRPRRKVTILGDTSDASAIIPYAKDSDILVHEVTRALLPTTPPREQISYAELKAATVKAGHSLPDMAATLAAQINCRQLWVTHLSPMLTVGHHALSQKKADMIVEQLRKSVPPTMTVRVAQDYQVVSLPRLQRAENTQEETIASPLEASL